MTQRFMSRGTKASFLFFIFCVAILFCLKPSLASAATGGVPIDSNNFPDDAFRELVGKYDMDEDAFLNASEIESITELDMLWTKVNSVQGIEWFHNLKSLNCSYKQIKQLDLSCFPYLRALDCSFNELTDLDIQSCASLEELYCRGNKLQTLQVSNCPGLRILDCQDNLLTTLDVSECVSLTELNCSGNFLESLTITDCPKLASLNCSANQLNTLELTTAPLLSVLCCNFNHIDALDVSNCPALVTLDCIGNYMSQLTLGHLSALKNLFCGNNRLTSLDISGCPGLEKLNCCYNSLRDLNWSNCPALYEAVMNGDETYNLTPSVITFIIPDDQSGYSYSLELDQSKRLTVDADLQILPSAAPPLPDASCPLLLTDPKSWNMPDLAIEYWNILTVRAQGAEKLNYLNTCESDDYPSRYYLYDIDKNGIPELIVEGSGGEANRAAYIFSEKDGRAVYIGKIHTGHTSFCSDPRENGILQYHAHMGSMSINRVKIIDGQLQSEVVVPATDGFKSSLDYPPVESFIPGAVSFYYYCKVDNPILFRSWAGITEWLENPTGYDLTSNVWPENNENYYSDIINGNQNVLLRGVIYRENYTPYLPFSSVLSYVRKTYSSANSTEQYMLSIQNDLYSDFNGDGVTDCLLLLADAEGRVRIPLILSYNDRVCFAYTQEDLSSQLLDIRLSENEKLEYQVKTYLDNESEWIPVELAFFKDCFLYVRGR